MGYYGDNFGQLEFPKTGAEIVERVHAKAEALKVKLADREKALDMQLKDAGLTDTMSLLLNVDDLLHGEAMSSANTPSDVKVRIQNIVRKVRDEREELERLNLVIRNLPKDKTFDLSFGALTYFGF